MLPCFHLIKNAFPFSDISLLTNKPVRSKAAAIESVLGHGYFFNKVLAYPVGTRNPVLLFKLLVNIRREGFTTLVNITAARSRKSAMRDKLFFRLAGIKTQIGSPDKPALYLNLSNTITGEYEWEAIRIARRISVLGNINFKDNSYWDLKFTEKEIAAADQILLPAEKFFAISAGTKMQSKDWGGDNWISLVRQLKFVYPDYGLVMFGAAEESELSQKCIDAYSSNASNLCGKTSPRVSAILMAKSKLFIGHDSGPMHLAACVGTPCVAVFSARNLPGQWYPRGENNKIIYHKTDCAGCNLETCIDQHKKCILSITVDEVMEAVKEIIAINN